MRYELINNVECKVFEACDVEAVSEEPILLYWTKLAGKKSGNPPWNQWVFVPTNNADNEFHNIKIWLKHKVYEFATPKNPSDVIELIKNTEKYTRFPFE
jgi:hypothetical protein